MKFLVAILTCMSLLIGIAQTASSQQAGSVVKSVSYKNVGNGTELVQFLLNDAQIPHIFMLDGEKPRLVLDFAETTYAGKSTVPVEGGAHVRGIRIGFHNTPKRKTRVVVDLVQGSSIQWSQGFEVTSNLLSISISTAEKTSNVSLLPPKAPDKAPVVLASEKGKVKTSQLEISEKIGQDQSSTEIVKEPVTTEEDIADTKKRELADNEVDQNVPDEYSALVDVSFDNEFSQSGEMVLLKLNDFHPPEISTEEKDPPKIYCDFANARLGKGVKTDMETNGNYVKRVRLIGDEKLAGVRVVLDLVVGNNYDLQQVFFKEDNLFVLIVNTLEE